MSKQRYTHPKYLIFLFSLRTLEKFENTGLIALVSCHFCFGKLDPLFHYSITQVYMAWGKKRETSSLHNYLGNVNIGIIPIHNFVYTAFQMFL